MLTTEFMKFSLGNIRVKPVCLVHHKRECLAIFAKVLDHLLVTCLQAFSRIYQQQGDIGFIDSLQGLLAHAQINSFFHAGNAASINHDKVTVFRMSLPVLPVPGQACIVCHQGITRPRKPVEEGRFTHVWVTDNIYIT